MSIGRGLRGKKNGVDKGHSERKSDLLLVGVN